MDQLSCSTLRHAPPRLGLRGSDRALPVWMARLWPSVRASNTATVSPAKSTNSFSASAWVCHVVAVIELLKEVCGLSRVALLANATDAEGLRRYIELSNAAAGPLDVTVEPTARWLPMARS
jgi:hypothetical protein